MQDWGGTLRGTCRTFEERVFDDEGLFSEVWAIFALDFGVALVCGTKGPNFFRLLGEVRKEFVFDERTNRWGVLDAQL